MHRVKLLTRTVLRKYKPIISITLFQFIILGRIDAFILSELVDYLQHHYKNTTIFPYYNIITIQKMYTKICIAMNPNSLTSPNRNDLIINWQKYMQSVLNHHPQENFQYYNVTSYR